MNLYEPISKVEKYYISFFENYSTEMETSTSVIHDKSDFRLRNLITAYGVYLALMLLLIVAAVEHMLDLLNMSN